MDLLSSIIPRQQEKSDRALRGLYKLQKDSGEILEFVLNADNINDFAANSTTSNGSAACSSVKSIACSR